MNKKATYSMGTIARIQVERGAVTEFPVAERTKGGWQTGVHFYPDTTVTGIRGVYVHQPVSEYRDTLNAATQEAAARYTGDIDGETGEQFDDWGYADIERQAFVAGALFESNRKQPTAAAQLRKVADEFEEIAADIIDGEPATERDQRQQTAAWRAYKEAAHRIRTRADELEASDA